MAQFIVLGLGSSIFRDALEEQIRQEWKEEARAEGRQAEKREMIEQILRTRFGSLDEELASTIELLLPLPTAELTQLLLTLNQEELLTRFSDRNPS